MAPAPIPTLSEWGMIIFSLLLAGSAIWMMRRRRVS
ncbi:MAG: IPTL-CTERM sorting domain-containing protein [Desulfobacteraceae bacterium]|nr:MAG: IPTL-CTERM sorting domain-containing protein [Desulfobacteraceae bacterium]